MKLSEVEIDFRARFFVAARVANRNHNTSKYEIEN